MVCLLRKLLGIFLYTVFTWQRQGGRALDLCHGQTGSVSFVQRFGGALNFNPHVYSGFIVTPPFARTTAGAGTESDSRVPYTSKRDRPNARPLITA